MSKAKAAIYTFITAGTLVLASCNPIQHGSLLEKTLSGNHSVPITQKERQLAEILGYSVKLVKVDYNSSFQNSAKYQGSIFAKSGGDIRVEKIGHSNKGLIVVDERNVKAMDSNSNIIETSLPTGYSLVRISGDHTRILEALAGLSHFFEDNAAYLDLTVTEMSAIGGAVRELLENPAGYQSNQRAR